MLIWVIFFILFEYFESGKRPDLPDFSPNEKIVFITCERFKDNSNLQPSHLKYQKKGEA